MSIPLDCDIMEHYRTNGHDAPTVHTDTLELQCRAQFLAYALNYVSRAARQQKWNPLYSVSAESNGLR